MLTVRFCCLHKSTDKCTATLLKKQIFLPNLTNYLLKYLLLLFAPPVLPRYSPFFPSQKYSQYVFSSSPHLFYHPLFCTTHIFYPIIANITLFSRQIAKLVVTLHSNFFNAFSTDDEPPFTIGGLRAPECTTRTSQHYIH